MYIKRVRKSNPNCKKAYEYLHLVENVRTENGPRQRLILNLGSLKVEPDKYKELANCIEAMLTGQKQLFSANRHIEKLARTAAEKIRSKQAVNQGVDEPDTAIYEQIDAASMQAEYVCHCIWNELNINAVLLCEGISEHILPLMQALVIGRLVSPGSEVHTYNWAEKRSALYELTGVPLRASLNSLYRAGDRLFECKDALVLFPSILMRHCVWKFAE